VQNNSTAQKMMGQAKGSCRDASKMDQITFSKVILSEAGNKPHAKIPIILLSRKVKNNSQ